jgi:multidrug efflux pump
VNIFGLFIYRPVATVLLSVGIVLLGIVAYIGLPIASLPTVERPMINVQATLPGASAETVASSLTSPLERELALISGLRDIVSSSVAGQSSVMMEFNLDKDLTAAAGAVQAAINRAGPLLPKNLPAPPKYIKANPAGFPILAVALTSDVYDAPDLFNFADTIVAGTLSRIEGVAKVFINGAARPAVRIDANPRTLADMQLSVAAIRSAVSKATENLPKGQISDGYRSFTIAANDQLFKASDFEDIVIEYRNGSPIKLRDVANVVDGTVNYKRGGWFNGKRAVILYVVKEIDANVVKTVEEVRKTLQRIYHWIPPSVDVNVVYDRTVTIRAALADVQFTIVVAVILVVLVIALFLRRLWATIIPSVTIPISLAATLGAMYLLGFSLNNLSLMALTIAVGFVIDDAVIIIENITRLIEKGEPPLEAALKGTRQMGFTVMSVTAALIAALIPILFMPDIVGRLFREFGLTLAVAIFASAIVSLTLTPMMCGQLLSIGALRPKGRIGMACERAIACTVEGYARSLDWVLRWRWLTLGFAGALLGASVVLYVHIPKGFLPTQDTGLLRVRTVGKSNTSFNAMAEAQQAVGAIIQADPAVENVASYLGTRRTNLGTMLVGLKPHDVRKEPIAQTLARLRKNAAAVQTVLTFVNPVQDVSVGARRTAARFQYALTAFDSDELVKWARIMRRKIERLPQANDVIWNYERSGLEVGIQLNRTRAARAAVSTVDVDEILYDWFGQRPIETIRTPINYSRVILEVEPRFRDEPIDLSSVLLTNAVPVEVLSRTRRKHAAMWINHDNRLPGITISFDTPIGVSISQAQEAIRAAEIEARLPSQIKTSFKGEAREAEQSNRTQPLLFLAAIVAVYIILGILYESFAHPLTILSTLPSATFGALLALMATKTQFTIITAIACILLVGIVMKNAIMMVDFALAAQRSRGLSPREAIREAARLRFRPIIMTTLAALLAALPLALGSGVGSELRQPLGVALVGGLLLSQFVTLYTTPVIYLAVDAAKSWCRRNGNDTAAATAPSGTG